MFAIPIYSRGGLEHVLKCSQQTKTTFVYQWLPDGVRASISSTEGPQIPYMLCLFSRSTYYVLRSIRNTKHLWGPKIWKIPCGTRDSAPGNEESDRVEALKFQIS